MSRGGERVGEKEEGGTYQGWHRENLDRFCGSTYSEIMIVRYKVAHETAVHLEVTKTRQNTTGLYVN